MNDPKGGVAKVTCPTFEAMGQIPAFHRTYFLLLVVLEALCASIRKQLGSVLRLKGLELERPPGLLFKLFDGKNKNLGFVPNP